MEFKGVFGGEFGVGEDAEGFEDGDYTGAVVVCAGATGGGRAAGGVEVRSDDYEGAGLARDAGDDVGLGEGVRDLG